MNCDQFLFEISNLRKSETGIPVNIFVSSGSVDHKHGPRIKAQISTDDNFTPYNTISIILKKDLTVNDIIGYEKLTIPKNTIQKIRTFVNLNYDILLQYWNDEISTKEMINNIQPLNNNNE